MIAQWIFNETSPSTSGTFASSSPVMNSANYVSAGIAAPLDDLLALNVTCVLQGAIGGSLDIFGQALMDENNTWVDIFHLPQLAAAASPIVYGFALGVEANTIQVVGTNLSPALAANSIAFGGWSTRMRLVFVAGAGTSGGTKQTVYLWGQRPEYGRRY